MDDEPRLKPEHLREAKFCFSGVKNVLAAHGAEDRARELIKVGIPIKDIQHIDDILIQKAVKIALRDYEEKKKAAQ